MSNKLKLKRKPIIKRHGKDIYKFINGVAVVPGSYFRGRPMTITLKEFNEALKEDEMDRV